MLKEARHMDEGKSLGLFRRRDSSSIHINGHHNCYHSSKICNSRDLSLSREAASYAAAVEFPRHFMGPEV
jgi:hypothetical protein